MKKQILSIGKTLSKTEQKAVSGGVKGFTQPCFVDSNTHCDYRLNSVHGANPTCQIGEWCKLIESTDPTAYLGECKCA